VWGAVLGHVDNVAVRSNDEVVVLDARPSITSPLSNGFSNSSSALLATDFFTAWWTAH